MPDPIQVERNFQELNGRIESSLSIRHRYRLFREFIDMLEGAFKKYESYIVQLLDEMPLYSTPLTWSGMDPIEIESDLMMLEKIQARIALSEKNENFNEIKRNLQEVCLLLFGCLNDAEKVDYYLKKITGLSWLDNREHKKPAENTSKTIHRLHNLLSLELQAGPERGKNQQNSLSRLHNQLTILLKNKGWNVLIPVAEKYEKEYFESSSYGRLRKMTVELYGEAEGKTGDELVWTSNIYGAEVPALGQTTTPIKAARNLFEFSFSKRTNKKYYRGGIRFENTGAIHDGQSANLAIAALWYTHLLKVNGHRQRYYIQSNAAITGDVDETGSVLPVDKRSIRLKARGVFFSWAKCLVIPDAQRNLFESEIQKLQELYPNRILPIVGVNHLRGVFYDRRVAVHHIQGRIPYLLNRIKSEYSKYILIPIIIILLLIITRLAYGPIDRNPVDIEYAGSHIILKNETGSVIDRIEVGETTVDYQNNGPNQVRHPLAVLIDITGNGFNELVFSNRVIYHQPGNPVLKAYSIQGDSLLWEVPLEFRYNYPRQSAMFNSTLRVNEVGVVGSGNNSKIIVNSSSGMYFQNVLFRVNTETGNIESEYVHPGRLNDMYIFDINNDGDSEIILTGVNNAYWLAVVTVLQSNFESGYAPATQDYIPDRLNRANEQTYLLVPKTIVGEYYNPVYKYNKGDLISYDSLSETFFVQIQEGASKFFEINRAVRILVYFNRDMQPMGVGSNDNYDIVAKDLYDQDKISFIPDYDYFEAYQDSILYWNGEEFLKTNEFFKN